MKKAYIQFLKNGGSIDNINSSVLLSFKRDLSSGLYCFLHEAQDELKRLEYYNDTKYQVTYIKKDC